MKARHVIWPVVVLGALGLMGACSSDGGDGTATGFGGEAAGGGDGTGAAGKGSGATSSGGGTDSSGGMTAEAGSTGVVAGNGPGNEGGAGGGPAVDLCEGLDLECDDDSNPCTEDECNPATGECGIPRSETACDDGLYCNGADVCVEGECTAGEEDPCNGRTCNEAMDQCECVTDGHCAADMPGEWGECEYATECSEIGERSRLVTTFTCTEGMCVQGAMNEDEACGARETDTTPCASDGLRCNGTEFCKNGACTPNNANQCPNQPATPNCAETGTLCNECTSNTHCGSGEKCCNRACIPTGNICYIVIPTTALPTTTIVISG